MTTLYLLHFDRPYPGGRRPQHYIGTTRFTIEERMMRHRNGRGAALIRAAEAQGIVITVACTVEYSRKKSAYCRERAVKALKGSLKRYCPHCGGKPLKKGGRLTKPRRKGNGESPVLHHAATAGRAMASPECAADQGR